MDKVWENVLGFIQSAKEELAQLPDSDELADKVYKNLEAIETDIQNAGV